MLNTCAEIFADHLKSKEIDFNSRIDKDGDSVISILYDGKTIKMLFTGEKGTYLSIYNIYENVPEDNVGAVIYECNRIHSQYKWITLYVDNDNDLVMKNNAILSVGSAADEAFELFIRMVSIMKEIKPQIMKTIYG